MAEWLKAHDWKSCGQCPRGFESHPVRSVMSLSYFATSTYKKISESRLNPTPTHLQTEREMGSRRTSWPHVANEASNAYTISIGRPPESVVRCLGRV